MTDLITTPPSQQTPLSTFTEKAYLDYSMYVILDRALPHIADGFKPVQRRIVYAMSELGLRATAKYKKSARTVGDVLGKFHPHGDSACYEAMVHMAQPFSYRYPLIDGQGNWGSADDPKSFAAMRYTESRLSPYAALLLSELGQGTVDWIDNFDGTLSEPALLPARLPNILLNGATGIAVGMSSDILPHNLQEVADACVHLLENPKADLDSIIQYIKGPDFPTHAEIITPSEQIKAMYAQGVGSIKMRAVYNIEQQQVIISALPYQVSGAKIMEQIAAQMQQKKLPMVDDLRDESDHQNPTRLVIVLRSNRTDTDTLMSHLFATTDLERNYRLNFNVIGLDRKPRVKPLLTLLHEWIHFRFETVTKRLKTRLQKVADRLHILDGLLIAYLNLDEVIAIIRESDEPKPTLMSRFSLSEAQADAILDTKLRHLAKLEEMKLKSEQDELSRERDTLEKTLNSKRRMTTLIKKEIIADRKTYGDERRSPIANRPEARALSEQAILPNEPLTVILSQNGWVRAAKGHDIDGTGLAYKAGDNFKAQTNARTNQQVLFFDTGGRVYTLPAHALPSARGQGDPLTSKLNPPEGASFHALVGCAPEDWLLLASSLGYGFLVQTRSLFVKNRNGKACLKLPQGSEMLTPATLVDKTQDLVACATNTGRLLLFPANTLPELERGKGNKLIHIPLSKTSKDNECVVAVACLSANQNLTVHAGKRHFTLKPADLTHYQSERAKRGHLLPRGLRQVSKLVVPT